MQDAENDPAADVDIHGGHPGRGLRSQGRGSGPRHEPLVLRGPTLGATRATVGIAVAATSISIGGTGAIAAKVLSLISI